MSESSDGATEKNEKSKSEKSNSNSTTENEHRIDELTVVLRKSKVTIPRLFF